MINDFETVFEARMASERAHADDFYATASNQIGKLLKIA